jgi:hypothetical protein
MVMAFDGGIKALGLPVALDDVCDAYPGEGKEGPVHGIKGYMGESPSQPPADDLRGGVVLGLGQLMIDGYALGRNLEVMLVALL